MTLAPLIIVSGPSGSGKSTLIRAALAQAKIPLRLAVSATTRDPRPGEVDGVDYLALAVRNNYRGGDNFHSVHSFLETLYISSRLVLPLKGIVLMGY